MKTVGETAPSTWNWNDICKLSDYQLSTIQNLQHQNHENFDELSYSLAGTLNEPKTQIQQNQSASQNLDEVIMKPND